MSKKKREMVGKAYRAQSEYRKEKARDMAHSSSSTACEEGESENPEVAHQHEGVRAEEEEDVGDADLSPMSMEYEENEVEESAESDLNMEEGYKDAE